MWRSLVILLIITTNLCKSLDSYKITTEQNSKTIAAYDQQDSDDLHNEHIQDNYSNEKSYKHQSNGRVVIGKWRNNGEALEPKWRDGDSVPLAPFSTISFNSGWRDEPDSLEDYKIERESFSENERNEKNSDSEPEEIRTVRRNYPKLNSRPREYQNYNSNPIKNGFNSETLIPTTEIYQNERIGYKNDTPRDRELKKPDNKNFSESVSGLPKIASTYKEFPSRRDNKNGNIRGEGKYRETLQNYPNEYELFENENDDPRPRKRRPPENYDFPLSLNSNNGREETHDENKQRQIFENQSNIANDVRRYLITSQNPTSDTKNPSKPRENVELKTFLKMQGNTLSLSEILQQKNLTLADILKGKPNAINILKSNDRKSESAGNEDKTLKIKSTPTEPQKIDSSISNPEIFNWSHTGRIVIDKTNKNSSFETEHELKTTSIVSQRSPSIDTTTTSSTKISNTDNEWISTKTEKTTDNISSKNPITLNNNDEMITSEKFVKTKIGEDLKTTEFLKPLDSRESLATEATTLVEGSSTKHLVDERHDSMTGDKFIPENNDQDEIMEFSDYPGKMPKFFGPILYESLNVKRKNIPSNPVRTRNPVDFDTKLSGENVLSSEKKSSSVINETGNVDEDSRKIVDETSFKNITIINVNDKEAEESERVKDETDEMKLSENENVEENYGNEKKMDREEEIVAKNVGNEFTPTTTELMNVDVVSLGSNNRQDGRETLPQDEKNLGLNHKLHEVLIPKADPQSRAEILELFSSGSSAERLERLLASRNMTIEELIALRQRGSSQVHFAEVFKAKEQASTSLLDNMKTDSPIAKNNEGRRNNEKENIQSWKENNVSLNVSFENEKNSTISLNSTEDEGKESFETKTVHLTTNLFDQFSQSRNLRNHLPAFDESARDFDTPVINPSIKSYEVDLNIESRRGEDSKKARGNSHITKMLENNIQKDSDGSSYYTSIEEVKLPVINEEIKKLPSIFDEQKTDIITSVSLSEIGHVEEIVNDDIKAIKKVYEINDYEYSEKKTQSKVKPSIIASGGILGVTIVVFLAIFITCRIQQKKKFTYKNSFTKAVFHNPVMNARKLSNTSSVNTIMVDVVATSTSKRPQKHEPYESDDFEQKNDIDNDSLDANDSWDTIPDFMK